MKKTILCSLILILTLFSCKSTEEEKNKKFVSYKFYCIEKSIADVGAWTISLDERQAKVSGQVFSFQGAPKISNLSLKRKENSEKAPFPFWLYEGKFENKKVVFNILNIDEANTQSLKKKFYGATMKVENFESRLSCWEFKE